jgi:hypothetical protein
MTGRTSTRCPERSSGHSFPSYAVVATVSGAVGRTQTCDLRGVRSWGEGDGRGSRAGVRAARIGRAQLGACLMGMLRATIWVRRAGC